MSTAAIQASGAQLTQDSPQGAFALDQVCLKNCGFPDIGAPGEGLADLPDDFAVLFGLGAATGATPAPVPATGIPFPVRRLMASAQMR